MFYCRNCGVELYSMAAVVEHTGLGHQVVRIKQPMSAPIRETRVQPRIEEEQEVDFKGGWLSFQDKLARARQSYANFIASGRSEGLPSLADWQGRRRKRK